MPRTRWTCLAAIAALLVVVNIVAAQNTQPPSKPGPKAAEGAVAEKKSGPRLHLGRSEWDFGQVWYGDPCETEVELKNVGDATLKIIKVKSSCGCTVAQPKKQELAPGETDTMTVKYNTKKYAKKVSQTITIETNDPVQPQARFRVLGEVWHVFDAKPSLRLFLGLLLKGSEASQSIELTNNLKEPVYPKLQPLKPDVPFDVKLEELEPGAKYRLTATTRPPLKPGSNSTTVVLKTGVDRLPTLSIPITAKVSERVSISPTRIVVAETQKNVGVRILQLSYVAEQPVEVTEIKASHPQITATVMPKRPVMQMQKRVFTQHTIRVSIPTWDVLPDKGASVEIYTTDPDPRFQKFVVPIEKRPARKPATKKNQRLEPILKPLPGQQPKTAEPARKPD